ncbi:hypothetical protein QP157_08660 [Sphingomonas sp. LR61]|uniref:hypothetical protein n=1 Tax=Sphingomonas sp. LR61 TaxID=3050234 RepID=UPI002FE2C50A
MAGAYFPLKKRLGGVAYEAAKVAVVAWGVLFFDPFIQSILPGWPEGLRYLLSALVGALMLEGILQFLFGWPRLSATWSIKDDAVLPDRELVARMSLRAKATQVMNLSISASSGGWVAHLLLRAIVGNDTTLHIRINESPLQPFVDYCSDRDGADTVQPNDSTHGFDVDLGNVPARAGQWHWAVVRWQAKVFPDDLPFNVYYVLDHENKVRRFLMRFLWMSTNVRTLRIVRK